MTDSPLEPAVLAAISCCLVGSSGASVCCVGSVPATGAACWPGCVGCSGKGVEGWLVITTKEETSGSCTCRVSTAWVRHEHSMGTTWAQHEYTNPQMYSLHMRNVFTRDPLQICIKVLDATGQVQCRVIRPSLAASSRLCRPMKVRSQAFFGPASPSPGQDILAALSLAPPARR